MQVKSSFKFQVLFFLSAGIHIIFLILFLCNKIYALATFNVFSVLFYIVGGIVSRGNIFKKYNIAWIVGIYIEIVAHALLCTLWLGFGTCFYLYILVALIVASYIIYLSNSKDKFLKIIISFAITTLIALIFSYVFLILNPPLMTIFFDNELTEAQIQTMSGINVFTNTFIVFFFSLLFIMEMHSLMEKLEETNQRLNYIANHDALTDLYNRHSLKDLYDNFIIGKVLVKSDDKSDISNNKSAESNHFCVIMGDVDNFKSINDTFGHTCGDLALKSVAKAIKDGVGDNDMACRWGGEEFLIFMRGEKDECIKKVERIRQNIELLRFEGEEALKVTMSFGLVDCSENRSSTAKLRKVTRIDELVQIADSRLYDAKSRGKNVVVFQ